MTETYKQEKELYFKGYRFYHSLNSCKIFRMKLFFECCVDLALYFEAYRRLKKRSVEKTYKYERLLLWIVKHLRL